MTVTSVRGIVKSSSELATKIDKDLVVEKEEEFTDAPDIESLVENKENEPVGLKPLTSFNKKDKLEEYGKGFGVDLDTSKTLAIMYDDLVEFVNK